MSSDTLVTTSRGPTAAFLTLCRSAAEVLMVCHDSSLSFSFSTSLALFFRSLSSARRAVLDHCGEDRKHVGQHGGLRLAHVALDSALAKQKLKLGSSAGRLEQHGQDRKHVGQHGGLRLAHVALDSALAKQKLKLGSSARRLEQRGQDRKHVGQHGGLRLAHVALDSALAKRRARLRRLGPHLQLAAALQLRSAGRAAKSGWLVVGRGERASRARRPTAALAVERKKRERERGQLGERELERPWSPCTGPRSEGRERAARGAAAGRGARC